MTATVQPDVGLGQFRHSAFFYADEGEWVQRSACFVRDGVELGEPVLVMAAQRKLDALRCELGESAGEVLLEDMGEIGLNPARLIPRWKSFISEHGSVGSRVRGIGEPIWPGRTAEQLAEAHRHEALINLAFSAAPAWILCPYDSGALPDVVLKEAERNHPGIFDGSKTRPSTSYRGLEAIAGPHDEPLAEPATAARVVDVTSRSLHAIRDLVAAEAEGAGMSAARKWDLVLAVNEVVTNSLRHGKGEKILRIWPDASGLICEVSDEGRIDNPMLGRSHPALDKEGGFGLWLVNQFCDLVQIRSFPNGSVVRLYMAGH